MADVYQPVVINRGYTCDLIMAEENIIIVKPRKLGCPDRCFFDKGHNFNDSVAIQSIHTFVTALF